MGLSKHFKRSNLAPKFFELHTWVKKCHFGNFSERTENFYSYFHSWKSFCILGNILNISNILQLRKYFEDFKIFTSSETFGQRFAPPKTFLKFDNFEETILLTFLQNKYEYFTPEILYWSLGVF